MPDSFYGIHNKTHSGTGRGSTVVREEKSKPFELSFRTAVKDQISECAGDGPGCAEITTSGF
jgi:hypothetical protein